MDPLGYVLRGGLQSQFEALAGRGAELEHEKIVTGPVGREGGVELGEGPLASGYRRGKFDALAGGKDDAPTQAKEQQGAPEKRRCGPAVSMLASHGVVVVPDGGRSGLETRTPGA